MSRHIRLLALQWVDAVWNRQTEGAIERLIAPDAVLQVEGVDGDLDWKGFRAYRRALLSAVPDLRIEVENCAVDGETTVLSWRATGRHTGPGLGLAPSGRSLDFRGVTWLEFVDGRVARAWDRWNRGEVLAGLIEVRISELRRRHGLTKRQAQVAVLMTKRRTHKEIARKLGIRPNTARRHCERVLRRLGVHRREDVAEALDLPVASVLTRHGSDLRPAAEG